MSPTVFSPTARPALALAPLLALALGFFLAQPSSAASLLQRAMPVVPAGNAWCGVADGGGSVRMTLTPDGRFVSYIEISTVNGTISTSEGTSVGAAQIADSKFIFRRDSSREECSPVRGRGGCKIAPCREDPPCRQAPCRGEQVCTTVQTNELLVRGTFTAPQSMHGTYSASQSITRDNRNSNSRRRLIGNYVAWPVGVAPCP